jgi:hypothetical protein
MTEPNNIEYVTSYEASEILGLRCDTFRKRHTRGSLKFEPVGRFGSHMIWRRADVEHYETLMEKP